MRFRYMIIIMKGIIPLVVSLQKQLSSSALGTGIMHKEQSLTLIIIIISCNIIHQQEGCYFENNTTTIFSSNFIAGLIIFIEIVDFRHTHASA